MCIFVVEMHLATQSLFIGIPLRNNGKQILIKLNITYIYIFLSKYALLSVFNFIKSVASLRTFKFIFQKWLDACL